MASRLLAAIFLLVLLQTATGADFNQDCLTTEACVNHFTEKYECKDGHCKRKFLEFTWMEISGLAIITVLVAMTNSGGVGAGTVITPTIIIFFLYPISFAIPQARVTITTGSLITFIMTGFSRKSNNPNRFQTDYSLAAVITPLLLAGSQVGVIFSRFLPHLVISVLLIGYICLSLYQTFNRATKENKKENKVGNASNPKNDSYAPIRKPSADSSNLEEDTTMGEFQVGDDEEKDSSIEIKTKGEMFCEELPNFVLIILAIGIFVLSSLFRGGRTIKSIIGIDECSEKGWLVLLGGQLFSLLLGFVGYAYNKRTFQDVDTELLATRSTDDTEMSSNEARIRLIFTTYIAGIIAGFIGVGGGMILGLYMLTLGMDVFSVTALSNFIVLISSGSTTFQFIAIGAVQVDISLIFMLVALIGSALGNLIFKRVLKKLRKPSLIVWLLFAVLWLALAALTYEAVDNVKRKGMDTLIFGRFC